MSLLAELCQRGLRFRVKGGEMQLCRPPGGLNDAEAEALAAMREQIRAAITGTTDAHTYLAHLLAHGPRSYGALAYELHWTPSRAWRAEEALRTAGRIIHDKAGRGVPARATKEDDHD